MPDATDAGTIHPEALKATRKRRGLSQEQLAKAIGCTKDTVSRWERGTARRVRSHLREPLCQTLGVRWEKLTEPPKPVSGRPGDVRIDQPIGIWANASLHLVAERYNVRPRDVLELAPLLFLIVAERSLLERERRLDDFRAKLHEADETLGNRGAHLRALIVAPDIAADDGLVQEERSISERDIFGRLIEYPYWQEDGEGPFVRFIRSLTEDLPYGAVEDIQSDDGDTVDWYRIAHDTLRECTGISDDDPENDEELGERILHYIHCGTIDLTECLRIKRSGDEAEYRQWLLEELAGAEEKDRLVLPHLKKFVIKAVERAKTRNDSDAGTVEKWLLEELTRAEEGNRLALWHLIKFVAEVIERAKTRNDNGAGAVEQGTDR